MRKFYLIKFDKFFEEDFLVDFVSSILKNLYSNKNLFYLNDVLIGEEKYYFIFESDTDNTEILVKEIMNYLPIQEHHLVN